MFISALKVDTFSVFVATVVVGDCNWRHFIESQKLIIVATNDA